MNNVYHLGINLGHDRSAAIVVDGEIKVAIQQERLDRSKHSLGYLNQFMGDNTKIQLPWESIHYCLNELGIGFEQLGSITANMPGTDYSADILKKALPQNTIDKIQVIPSHHLSHAYTAYWPSGFDKSLILSIDATGSTHRHKTESYSLYQANGNSIELLHSECIDSHLAELSTLGFLYEYITKKADFTTRLSDVLEVPEAGKLMGLASYGKHQKKWTKWFTQKKGSLQVDVASYDIFLEVEALSKLFDQGEGKAYLRPYIVDLAFKIQEELEEVMIHIVKSAMQQTGIKKLCIAGGVGLNSVANYKILQNLGLDDIFIFPAAGDSGIAAGNALWACHQHKSDSKRAKMHHAFLGRSYTDEEIQNALREYDEEIIFEKLSDSKLIEESARKLSEGSIIARHEGGCEFGPRALGHRSIIVDPTLDRMKDILNARVKFRESFRPFAPVVPEDISEEIFELETHSPFMLLVANVKKEFHDVLPAITHNDGTGRVQTVNKEQNPFFYNLAYQLKAHRNGPAVLLNTSFNVAGQPIVENPQESISTFLSTDIDYLIVDNYWISKRKEEVKRYEEHLDNLPAEVTPHGLDSNDIDVTALMVKLDEALFHDKKENQPWSDDELLRLSAFGARYREKSNLIKSTPLGKNFKSNIEDKAIIFLNPQGESIIRSLTDSSKYEHLNYQQVRLLSYCYNGTDEELNDLRISLGLSHREFYNKLAWASTLLNSFGIDALHGDTIESQNAVLDLKCAKITFEPFKDDRFDIADELRPFYDVLTACNYCTSEICKRLNINDLQSIQPTYMPYYSGVKLGDNKLDKLISLFLVRGSISKRDAQDIFGQNLLQLLFDLKVLYQRSGQIASYIDIFCVENHFIATDHRFLFLEEDKIEESPVMYIGSDSFGLVNTAPRRASECTLDLCTGSGIQSIVASKYSESVVAVDINPRAIRFARFNVQLNGVNNVKVLEGDLYEAVREKNFDTILANPPFVPSPDANMKFRDGGVNGENILSNIVHQAPKYLTDNGRLYIVTDLVDVANYRKKLMCWWGKNAAKTLLLKTADRNEILFSVPHCHYPFNQTYGEYSNELLKWVDNFKKSNLSAVNFGYILIEKSQHTVYVSKTISNPSQPIFDQVQSFFNQHDLLSENRDVLLLEMNPNIKVRRESAIGSSEATYKIFAEDNPFFTEYVITREVYSSLLKISKSDIYYNELCEHLYIDDLIEKGIIMLSLNRNRDKHKYQKTLPGRKLQHKIVEMETKTTPTCLTSYLKQ